MDVFSSFNVVVGSKDIKGVWRGVGLIAEHLPDGGRVSLPRATANTRDSGPHQFAYMSENGIKRSVEGRKRGHHDGEGKVHGVPDYEVI